MDYTCVIKLLKSILILNNLLAPHKAKKRKLLCCTQVEFLNIWVGQSEKKSQGTQQVPNLYIFHLFFSKNTQSDKKLGAFPTVSFSSQMYETDLGKFSMPESKSPVLLYWIT